MNKKTPSKVETVASPEASEQSQGRKSWTLVVAIALPLAALAYLVINKIVTNDRTFYGVFFPAGEVSFADQVVDYNPGIFFNQQDLPNVQEPFNNPQTALGKPNSSNLEHLLPSLAERNDVSLGFGGSITLQFTDNLLTASGNKTPDLWIFEAGGVTESVLVEISKDGVEWHSVGQTTRGQSGINLDAYGWEPKDFFSYVRLTDNPQEGEHEGVWRNEEWLGWGGADIDAVGARSSVSLQKSVSARLLFSGALIKLMLIGIATFIAGLGVGFLSQRRRNS